MENNSLQMNTHPHTTRILSIIGWMNSLTDPCAHNDRHVSILIHSLNIQSNHQWNIIAYDSNWYARLFGFHSKCKHARLFLQRGPDPLRCIASSPVNTPTWLCPSCWLVFGHNKITLWGAFLWDWIRTKWLNIVAPTVSDRQTVHRENDLLRNRFQWFTQSGDINLTDPPLLVQSARKQGGGSAGSPKEIFDADDEILTHNSLFARIIMIIAKIIIIFRRFWRIIAFFSPPAAG